jgi:hypothetical protein
MELNTTVRLAATLAAGVLLLPQLANAAASAPARNRFLAAEKGAASHVDPSQSDAIDFPAPRGVFRVDPVKAPRAVGGPVGYTTYATTSPNALWAASTSGVSYVDISNGGFRILATLPLGDIQMISAEQLDNGLAQRFTDVAQIETIVKQDWKIDTRRLFNNVYGFVDNDNVLYATVGGKKLNAYALVDPANPAAGIKLLRSDDFSGHLSEVAKGSNPSFQRYGAFVIGAALTYDGKLVLLTNRSLTVLNRDFTGERHTVMFGVDEYASNGMAIDEHGGIYVASDKVMRKIVWNGKALSEDEASGAWSSPYENGRVPPTVKLGTGTGSTPTLMGFGKDEDKLVVITDGADRMNLVAFWRDAIPASFKQQPGTLSRRIAGQIAVTCGLSPLPEFVQSEQSVVVKDYGAFVVNNISSDGAGHPDKIVDVLAVGPVLTAPTGAERFEWDTKKDAWRSLWQRPDVVSTSMVPAVSIPSNVALVNGYTKADGWEVTGMDWLTGKTVHRTIMGQSNLGNGAYATIQFIGTGDLLFNSVGGVMRVYLPSGR